MVFGTESVGDDVEPGGCGDTHGGLRSLAAFVDARAQGRVETGYRGSPHTWAPAILAIW